MESSTKVLADPGEMVILVLILEYGENPSTVDSGSRESSR